MVCRRRSFLIVGLRSLLSFGIACKKLWGPAFPSAAYHPQTDGQTERVNQVLEDMLRACVLSYGKHWEKCLPFAEFSYNNSFQASLGMAPFEALYGRKCRTPLNWSETTQIESFPLEVRGSPVIKSMPMESHFHSGTDKG